jgi:DNA-binding MarR family transcriptional regulator
VRIAHIPSGAAARGGPALFQLVRFWSRRWLRDDHADPDDHALDILVLEATDAALHNSRANVADVATQLGIDRSGASRLIASAEDHGYILRRSDEADARRVELSITRKGRALLSAARRWQSAVFLDLVADWDPAEASAFATYLVRLAQALESTHAN